MDERSGWSLSRSYRKFSSNWFALFVLIALLSFGDQAAAQVPAARGLQFVMSLARDLKGNIWVGSEEQGVWQLDVAAMKWRQFTSADGLGDDNGYALVCDKLGRIWVGHLNHGVSVYNGTTWQNYEPVGGLTRPDSLSGPLGERVFAIRICPTDGDVWIATNAGLSRYSESDHKWTYIVPPGNAVQSMAFDSKGNLYVGTYCDGIAITRAADNYRSWQTVPGPDGVQPAAAGLGLPGNFITDVLVSGDGTILAATTSGLGYSKDDGTTWRYTRGRDYSDKVRGMMGGAPPGWAETPADDLLAEDYITSLALDTAGAFWVGHREKGAAKIEFTAANAPKTTATANEGQFVTCILSTPTGPIVGTCGSGVQFPQDPPTPFTAPQLPAPPQPTGAPSPTAAELDRLLADVKTLAPAANTGQPVVLSLADDWRTRGEWIGRHGRYFMSLNGMITASPPAYLWGAGAQPVTYTVAMGPHHTQGDAYRYWNSSLYTKDPRALEMPAMFYQSRISQDAKTAAGGPRRQSEFVDNGQAYSASHQGPDLYINLSVPAGQFYLTLYSVNDNGHNARNRFRDNSISIRSAMGINDFLGQPELARGRFHNFWGGVYKRYLVDGPNRFFIRIGRDYSLNAKLSAVALDLLDPLPEPYYAPEVSTVPDATDSADRLFDAIEKVIHAQPSPTAAAEMELVHVQLARWYSRQTPQPTTRAAAMRYLTSLYRIRYFTAVETVEEKVGLKTVREIEQSLKWDGVSNVSGRGRDMIRQAMTLDAAPAAGN